MNKTRLFSVAAIAMILSSCATTDDPKDYQPMGDAAQSGQLCLYRTIPRITAGVWQDWVLDGRWKGQIRPDHYYCGETFVGKHIVRVGMGDEKLVFSVGKDQQVFVRFGSAGEKGLDPVLVDHDTALMELKAQGYGSDHPRSPLPVWR
jgi:hypothetical protein